MTDVFELEPIGIEDFPFRYEVYAATIQPYLDRMFGWTEEDHQRFLWDDLARSADHAAIVVNGARVGILQVVESDECITLGQIELLPDAQGRGVGTAVVRWLQDRAAALGKPVELHVFHDNTGAQRLYERLGFRVVSTTERDVRMAWTPESPAE